MAPDDLPPTLGSPAAPWGPSLLGRRGSSIPGRSTRPGYDGMAMRPLSQPLRGAAAALVACSMVVAVAACGIGGRAPAPPRRPRPRRATWPPHRRHRCLRTRPPRTSRPRPPSRAARPSARDRPRPTSPRRPSPTGASSSTASPTTSRAIPDAKDAEADEPVSAALVAGGGRRDRREVVPRRARGGRLPDDRPLGTPSRTARACWTPRPICPSAWCRRRSGHRTDRRWSRCCTPRAAWRSAAEIRAKPQHRVR